jgi:putative membrane protein
VSDAPSPLTSIALRGAVGGVLMGLANLVPGISGGTMLLAAGVYAGFIGAIADLSTLRWRPRGLVLLGAIAGSAALAILLFAGAVRDLVVHHRWLMYSLFIGLTLGGVPLLWRLARPATTSLVVGAAGAFALMCAMALGATDGGSEEEGALWMFAAGAAAASAMILPGVSGGYLLLLLGQYEAILGTIDQLKRGLLGDAATGASSDLALVVDALGLVVPLGLGIVVGIVGVSNALRWLLGRFEKATLGALLGLLLGAVVGLWPFREATPPVPGDVVKGRLVTVETFADFDPEDWPLRAFSPTPSHVAGSLAAMAVGLGMTWMIGRLGRETAEEEPKPTS